MRRFGQPRRVPLRYGSCDGLRLLWVTTSQSASLRRMRGEVASLREGWPSSKIVRVEISLLGILPRALLAGLDPELRERSCTDLGLDPALILCVPAVDEVPKPRWRGSAGATSLGNPLGGEGVRRGGGS